MHPPRHLPGGLQSDALRPGAQSSPPPCSNDPTARHESVEFSFSTGEDYLHPGGRSFPLVDLLSPSGFQQAEIPIHASAAAEEEGSDNIILHMAGE